MRTITLLLVLFTFSLGLGLMFRREIGGIIAAHLIVREAPWNADYIVVLLGGRRKDRTDQAAELLRQRYADSIVLCAGYFKSNTFRFSPSEDWVPAGLIYEHYLKENNVDQKNITLVRCGAIYDTASELSALADWLQNRGAKRILLVTSGAHSLRASRIWKRVSNNIAARTIGADDKRLQEWWTRHWRARSVLYEYVALLKERIRSWFD